MGSVLPANNKTTLLSHKKTSLQNMYCDFNIGPFREIYTTPPDCRVMQTKQLSYTYRKKAALGGALGLGAKTPCKNEGVVWTLLVSSTYAWDTIRCIPAHATNFPHFHPSLPVPRSLLHSNMGSLGNETTPHCSIGRVLNKFDLGRSVEEECITTCRVSQHNGQELITLLQVFEKAPALRSTETVVKSFS